VSHAMSAQAVDYKGSPGAPVADENLRGLDARYRVYDATDGWIFLAAPSEDDWDELVDALAPHVDLASETRFATEADRVKNDEALAEVLASVFATRGKDDWERDLLAADVACVAVTTEPIEAIMKSDDFGGASGYLADATHPIFDQHARLAPLVRFSRSATQAKPGVLAGTATDAVLDEVGYDEAARADLRARKIIG
jgi:crotonobetainyl-CoA:carnitine CoA-transferase CaiB-like acyl-CoA transferase